MPVDLDILESIAATLDDDRGETAAAYVREAIAEIRALRSRVVPPWVREKPTRPGWYWMKLGAIPEIVEIRRGTLPEKLVVMGHMLTWPPENARWSGPLPEPPEPT